MDSRWHSDRCSANALLRESKYNKLTTLNTKEGISQRNLWVHLNYEKTSLLFSACIIYPVSSVQKWETSLARSFNLWRDMKRIDFENVCTDNPTEWVNQSKCSKIKLTCSDQHEVRDFFVSLLKYISEFDQWFLRKRKWDLSDPHKSRVRIFWSEGKF